MKYDIFTIGGSTEDIMFYTEEAVLIKNHRDPLKQQLLGFEFGAKIIGEKVLFTYGGGGANTAACFAKLGLKAGIITAIGADDNGRRIVKNFLDHRVDVKNVQTYKSVPSGLSFIVNFKNTDEHVIFTYRSANDHLLISQSDLNKIQTRWLFLTALSGKSWKSNLKNIFQFAQKNKVKLAWNIGASQLKLGYRFLKPYLKQTAVLILNKDEATELALSYGKKTQDVSQLLLIIKFMGPKIVAITEGKFGATVCSDDEVCFEKDWPIKAKNSTGAGDAFGSAFVVAIINGQTLSRALTIGLIQSGYVVSKIGAQKGLLTWQQINHILKNPRPKI